MSMISEFVEKLKFYASEYNELPYGREVEGTGDLLKEAADIIEELSEKLYSANMSRSGQYCNGGWIPCEEALPEDGAEVLLTFKNCTGIYVGEATYKNKLFYYVADTEVGYYEQVFKNPIAWMPLPEPYKGE